MVDSFVESEPKLQTHYTNIIITVIITSFFLHAKTNSASWLVVSTIKVLFISKLNIHMDITHQGFMVNNVSWLQANVSK